MKKRSALKKAVAVACSLALGAALVPAMAISAFAEESDPVVLTVQLQDEATGAVVTPAGGEFTQAQLEELAAKNTEMMNYVLGAKKNTTYQVFCTNKYVLLEDLLACAGDKWAKGSTATFVSGDYKGMGAWTYESLTDEQYFYSDFTLSEEIAGEGTPVKAVVALSFNSSLFDSDTQTAGDLAKVIAEGEFTTDGAPRDFMGLTKDVEKPYSGGASVQGIDTITITCSLGMNDATVTASNKTYTGKKQTITPKVAMFGKALVEGTDYTVAGNAQTKAGTYTMTITGVTFAGTATAKYTIKQAFNKITVKVAKKTYKVKAVKKAKKNYNIGAKAKFGKIKYSITKKAKKAGISVSSKGKVTVKKGTKKGTYKITLKVAKTANYKAATKTVRVIVK